MGCCRHCRICLMCVERRRDVRLVPCPGLNVRWSACPHFLPTPLCADLRPRWFPPAPEPRKATIFTPKEASARTAPRARSVAGSSFVRSLGPGGGVECAVQEWAMSNAALRVRMRRALDGDGRVVSGCGCWWVLVDWYCTENDVGRVLDRCVADGLDGWAFVVR
jgi:hypothetical protein